MYATEFSNRKTKDMGYLSMTQNQYMPSKKHKKQRNKAFTAVLHLKVTVRHSTQSRTLTVLQV